MRTDTAGGKLYRDVSEILVDLRCKGKIHAVTGLDAERFLRVREKDAVKTPAVKLDAEFQMLFFGADPIGTEQRHVTDAQHRPRVGAAVRLEPVQLAHILDAQQCTVAQQQVAGDVRLFFGQVAEVIRVQRFPEGGKLFPADVQPGGKRVAAEALQMLAAGGKRLIQVESAAAAAGPLPALAVEADHHRGDPVLIGKPRGGNPDHALMPAVRGQHDGPVRRDPLQLGLRILPDFIFDFLPLAVQLAQLFGKAFGLMQVRAEQQLFRFFRLAEAARRVQTRGHRKADIAGGRPARRRTGLGHHGLEAGPRVLFQLFQAFPDKIAVFAVQRHHVGDGADGNQVGISAQHAERVRAAGAGQLEGDADTGQLRIRIGILGPFGIDNRAGLRQRAAAALVVIGDDQVQPDAAGKVRFLHGRNAAVHRDHQAASPVPELLQRGCVQPVAFLIPVRDIPAAWNAAASQIIGEKAGSRDAVYIVVSVNRNLFPVSDCLPDPFTGTCHPKHGHRVVQQLGS